MTDLEEAICTWPNGETKRVIIMRRTVKDSLITAHVTWNERHDPIPGAFGCVTGLDAEVPSDWLSPIRREDAP